MNRKQLAIAFFAIALLMLLAVRSWADGGVQGSLTPDRAELTVGDPVRLTLEVNHPAGYQIIIPKLEQAWGRPGGTRPIPGDDRGQQRWHRDDAPDH